MVKLRMTTVDVAAEVKGLRKLIGMRCANIYDLSSKTYIIKLAKSSGVAESGESEKALALLESGVRLHTTEFARDKSSTPSGFTLKLRTHLRTRRLEDVRQLGIDRVVDFQFGLGDTAHHLILELYAQGNIVLTDSNYNILQLLRSWKDEEKGVAMMTRSRYPIDTCRVLEKTTVEKMESLFKAQNVTQPDEVGETPAVHNAEQDGKKTKVRWGKDGSKGGNQESVPGGKKGPTLKYILGEGLGYGPVLIEHIILDAALQPSMEIGSEGQSPNIADADFSALVGAVNKFEDWLLAVTSGQLVPEGFIFMQKPSPGKKGKLSTDENPESEKIQIYDEFYPLILKQLEGREYVKFETFDGAMDEFFSKVEGQRAQQQRKAQEDTAVTKLEKIRADQTKRVKTLKKEVDQSVHMAELIEYNLDSVDAGISAVRAALANGMDWKDLGRMIKDEKKAGNPVAGLIHSLQLETNQITLLLSNNLDEMDEEEKTQPVDKVVVDLSLSAHANARHWFETKKRHATKQEKTVAAHEKAFKAAEKKTQQQLAQAKTVAAITHIRKVHWFEKFNWFISSENFLVISGRDAQQNELIVKRYMKKGDLYVHADLHGASSTIIKNNDPSHPIPPLTINQAGCFTVCRSQAWDAKIVTSAWWVEAHQVSKTAPTGEYLTVGSFMVRGKKNFLPPNPLVMGYGFLFRLDESSIAAHLNERHVRGEDEGEGEGAGEAGIEDPGLTVDGRGPEKEMLELQVDDGDSDPTSGDDEVGGINPGSEDDEDKVEEPKIEDVDEKDESSKLDDLLDQALQLRSAPQIIKGSSKYELEDIPTIDVFSEEPVNISKTAQREKPYVSKAERRKLKKGGKQEGDTSEKDNAGKEMLEKDLRADSRAVNLGGNVRAEESPSDSKEEKGVGTSTKPGRGRKGKMKKMKERYSEQDEEERELRMSLLASAGRKVPGGNDKDDKGSTKGKTNDELTRAELDSGLKVCYKCKQTGHIARDCPNETTDQKDTPNDRASGTGNSGTTITSETQDLRSDDTATVQGKDTPAHGRESGKAKDGLSRRAHAKASKVEIAAIMAEENLVELGDDEKEKLTELDSLSGKPLPSDVLLYAVPVCGPYSALQAYKYRVKLTPGTAKRGKGAKTAVDVVTRLQEVTAREKELIKAVTDPELVACMIGNSKVTAPGLSKLKQTQKKSKKSSAK